MAMLPWHYSGISRSPGVGQINLELVRQCVRDLGINAVSSLR